MVVNTRIPVFRVCEQQRRTPICTSMQADQSLYFSLLESIISKLATNFIFYLVSVAEEAGLGKTWSETPKTDFLVTRPISYWTNL